MADNGIGFSDAYREKIFGAFERLHGRTSPYSGSGIGLSIVRRVMENHQGAVTAHSVEGEGATFTLYFPVEAN
ncbi:Histidine kinase-, DNA gyrase B-, and HSP90-like ATPase [Spirosoma fluviale]|uniref:histidine kinase n=1 Tax=Spirosoma fluviale TaxID=1597977 RepID=A0A286GAA8_9BACT|nr:Histidine kinase-, DNA gyrase B-, and HSP90-like ATPase [Spirosoma fluviale]